MTYLLSSASSLQNSSLSAVGLAFTLIACLLLLLLPRRLALVPIAVTACYMTFGQQFVVAGLHFTILRILVVVAVLRILLRREYRWFEWRRLDALVALWSLSSIIFFTILWGSTAATINRLGVASDTAGLYFIFRILVREIGDIKFSCKLFALALVPLAACMTFENISGGRNPFHSLGGVPELSEIRNGVLRCQGPFAHPILAGTFGAVWAPLFIGLWYEGKNSSRLLAAVGLISCTIVTITSGSSGPIMTYVFGILATCMWIARRHMSAVRWSSIAGIAGLSLAMNDPVWFIFARVNVLSGSTGWHRSNLIDQTIRHFDDWWLFGTKEVGLWGVWAGDITNQYILEGVNGGLLTACLFIAIVTVAFSNVGRAMKVRRTSSSHSRKLTWAVGCALFAHAMTLLSVSYFDQNVVNFYLVLAMIAPLSAIADGQRESPCFEPSEWGYRRSSPWRQIEETT